MKKTYTYEEVLKYLNDVMNLGMGLRQDQLNGYSSKSGRELLNEYINKNVKSTFKKGDPVIYIDDSISDEEKKVYIVDEILTTNDEYCFLYSKNTDDTYQYCAKISELKKIK